MAVARHLVDHHYLLGGVLTLRRWRGAFQEWNGGAWAEAEEAKVRAETYRHVADAYYLDEGRPKPWAPTRGKINDALDAMQAMTHTPATVAPPTWLVPHPGDPPAGELVSVGNGLLHVPSRRLLDHTPRFFNTVSVPFDYDASAPEPSRWLAFLESLWPGDSEAIEVLQEWFGYVISGEMHLHKMLFVVGPLRSGKGTIARVLTALVGRGATCGPTLASLATNFGLSPLIGKSLAIIADARLGGGSTNVVVERLLSISGEDSLTIDRKYREPWTGQLGTRFTICSNELPRLGDASGAIASRMVLLSLKRSWLGMEDTNLTGELITELPGVLCWALDGLDRLHRQGRFTEPASSADATATLADLVSPVAAFVRECCVVGSEYEVPTESLYNRWRTWCEEHGHRPGSEVTFGRDLRAAVGGLSRSRLRIEGDRVPHYTGLGLRCDDPGKQWPGPRDNPGHVDSSPVVSRLPEPRSRRSRPLSRVVPG